MRVRVEVGGEQVVITGHAASRWRERRRPQTSVYSAARQLQIAIGERGELRRLAPLGFPARGLKHEVLTVAWIVFPDGPYLVVLPLTNLGGELVATTCLCRRNAQ